MTTTKAIWPISTPTLNISKASGISAIGMPTVDSPLAKPKPCSNPKPKATVVCLCGRCTLETAVAFGFALAFIYYTKSELLTSNMMIASVGAYYHSIGWAKAGRLMFFCYLGNAIGGLTFGADPLAVATALTSELKARPINAFSIRKTRKDHGMIRWIEGDIQPGERVAIIDDVATTGGSTIKAIKRARAEGLEVVRVVILVDRQEGGVENIKQHVSKVSRIITRDELVKRWQAIQGASSK